MTMPAAAQPLGEPVSESLSEAAQAAAMSIRLILTIADAVRRASQKHHQGKEQELPENDARRAEDGWAADELGNHLPTALLTHLTTSPDWPVMARQLLSLSHAGVDLPAFLPHLGQMASGVERAVARNTARTKAEGTDRWADLLRATMPQGLVRDAILSSPAWPDIAAAMGRLHDQRLDVARILTDAHTAGLGVDQAVAAATARATQPRASAPAPAPASAPATAGQPTPRPAPTTTASPASSPAPTPAPAPAPAPAAAGQPTSAPAPGSAPHRPASPDAKRVWGPLTEGITIPSDLDLSDRTRALDQLSIHQAARTHYADQIRAHLPPQEADVLLNSRLWPLLAARMRRIDSERPTDIGPCLARLSPDDASWRTGPPAELTKRLVIATHHALTTPPGQPLPTVARPSTTAARSRSTTTSATGQPPAPSPAQPAAPARHRQAAPAPRDADDRAATREAGGPPAARRTSSAPACARAAARPPARPRPAVSRPRRPAREGPGTPLAAADPGTPTDRRRTGRRPPSEGAGDRSFNHSNSRVFAWFNIRLVALAIIQRLREEPPGHEKTARPLAPKPGPDGFLIHRYAVAQLPAARPVPWCGPLCISGMANPPATTPTTAAPASAFPRTCPAPSAMPWMKLLPTLCGLACSAPDCSGPPLPTG
ncbi:MULTISPECIES: hypothetical protein [Streptomyces]|uniref:hypothetical protein n=1 Tax=Streptomyces TaxID=1883 RepID=UPI0007C4568F|nr:MULTISPECIES: hypothetical protein [Streptomyces]MDP9947251.1 hypothetical protein [Streptomyces sp. DSM 41269]MDP9954359.1 hypothetical protein [Streptomyces sp. DSM 41269]